MATGAADTPHGTWRGGAGATEGARYWGWEKWCRRVMSDPSEAESELSLADASGLSFVDRTERDMGGRLLIKERYRNNDGRVLILFHYSSLTFTSDNGSKRRDG